MNNLFSNFSLSTSVFGTPSSTNTQQTSDNDKKIAEFIKSKLKSDKYKEQIDLRHVHDLKQKLNDFSLVCELNNQ